MTDREQFRTYLQESGAVAAISRVFLKLYELKEHRPKSSIKYIAQHIVDTTPSLTEYESMKDDLNAIAVLLAELKVDGKLNKDQLDVIDKTIAGTLMTSDNSGSAIESRKNP